MRTRVQAPFCSAFVSPRVTVRRARSGKNREIRVEQSGLEKEQDRIHQEVDLFLALDNGESMEALLLQLLLNQTSSAPNMCPMMQLADLAHGRAG